MTRLLNGLRQVLPDDLPSAARGYIALVNAVGAALLAVALVLSLPFDELARFLLFLLLACLASVLKITVPLPRALAQQGSTMSLSFTMNFAALLVLGVHEATLLAAAGAWAQCTFNARQKTPAYRTLFSIAAMAITLEATGWVYLWSGGSVSSSLTSTLELMALAAAASTHFIVNSGLVAGAIALSARQPLSRVWAANFAPCWVNPLVGAALGVLLARGVGQTRAWLVPITGLLLLLTYRTYRVYYARIEAEQRAVQDLSDLHAATIEALALAIDAKDRDSRTHLRRLQEVSLALARAEGLNEEEAQAVKTAALLHDIGLLAVPQHILSKTGRLTPEEHRKMRIHPQVGAEIIRGVPFPSPVAPIILAHHERWDGNGYPVGLRGEMIPIGARILAVADRFDAILSERRDVTLDEAAVVLRTESEYALDPRLVSRFIELLPQIHAMLTESTLIGPATDGAQSAAASHAIHVDVPVAASPAAVAEASNPYANIARAHREVQALYDIAQALSTCLSVGEALSQLSSRLNALVPASTLALFLRDETRGQIVCRAATGPGASQLEPMRVPMGAGPMGWVVEQQRSLVNVSLAVTGGDDFGDDVGGTAGETDLHSALICPLHGDTGCLGALVVAQTDPEIYHDDHRRILEQVAAHVAAAIQNALRFEQTHEAALTDRLTGLTNSRGLAAAFDSVVAHAMAFDEPLSVLMIDVDDLKTINDGYGHAAGDRALREVARVLSQSVRARDICARYAGDEFVLVLRACGGAEAERRAQDLQSLFHSVRFAPSPAPPDGLLPLHISIGAASCPADGATLEALLVVADQRMYHDKSRRKDQREDAPAASQVSALRPPEVTLHS